MPLALSLIGLVQPASLRPRITDNVSTLCSLGSADKIADHLAHEGVTNGIAGWMTSGDRGDVGKCWVAEEAAEDVRQALQPA
jgi:hypothetical protein